VTHGVWTDIRETDVLENWRLAREGDNEKHVCPLQLEVIRRCVRLYTLPGETVLDPFMGIGSTAVVALEQERNAIGFELKESYHRQAVENVERFQAKLKEEARTLFNWNQEQKEANA
jgi:DNA modification methylase